MGLNNREIQLTEKIKVSGVGMVIEDMKGNILLVLENDNKAWKRSGQWSTPFGTSKKGELPIDTAIRELKEETGISIHKDQLIESGDMNISVLGDNTSLYDIHVTVFHIIIDSEILQQASNFKNCEIRKVCLEKLHQIKQKSDQQIRPGVLEALYLVKESKKFPYLIRIKNGYYEDGYNTTTLKVIRNSL